MDGEWDGVTQPELDVEWDADLVGMAPGSRSALIRGTLGAGRHRRDAAPPVEDIEGKDGAKLDRMLGGLAARE